jgi:hypothetical protein
MAKINPRYVSTFRAPTEYERQLEEARRRAAMAEALAQQEYQPMEGAAAPIPAAAPLVKALQGFMTARAGRQAQEAAEAAKRTEGEYAGRIAGRIGGMQMPQAPETLEEYKPRAADFARGVMARQAETDLNEVTPTSQYRYDPNEALQMASTSVGTAALKDRPVLAQRIAEALKKPEAEEFGTTPVKGEDGNYYVVSKTGRLVKTDVAAPKEANKPPTTHGNLQWNAATQKWENIPGYKTGDSEGKRVSLEDRYRREFDNATKTDLDELSQIGKVQTILGSVPPGTKPNAIQQDVLVTLLMKFIEPGSVVREGEYDRLVSRQGLVARAQTLMNKIQTGEPLTGEAINQIAGLARLFNEAANNRVRKKASQISTLANNRGLDVNNIVLNPDFLKPQVDIGSTLTGGSQKPSGNAWTPELQKELDELERRLQGK